MKLMLGETNKHFIDAIAIVRDVNLSVYHADFFKISEEKKKHFQINML